MTSATVPALGLAVSTIGRPALADLLASAAGSSRPPAAVAIANQSGGELPIDTQAYPFPVSVVPSSGGVSRGRNDAAAALPDTVEILAFPNDDTTYPPATLEAVAGRFARADAPAALACDPANTHVLAPLPPAGVALDRYTVWRAIEWAIFVDRAVFRAHGGLRDDLGTGAPAPWQSGEGTDLLLRLLDAGMRVEAAPDIAVHGVGERRGLADEEFVAKHRRYARGTGYVYRVHRYPGWVRARSVVAPWLRLRSFDVPLPLALRIARARSVGRLEGLRGRTFGRGAP